MTPDGPPDQLVLPRPWPRPRRGLERVAVAAMLVAFLGVCVLLSAWLAPRLVGMKRVIVQPVRQLVSAPSAWDSLPDLGQAACGSLVALAFAKPVQDAPPGSRTSHSREEGAKVSQAFLLSPDGFILSGATDLPQVEPIFAQLADGRVLSATINARDDILGLTLLKIEARDLRALAFAGDDFPRLGTWVFAASLDEQNGCVLQPTSISRDLGGSPPATLGFGTGLPMSSPPPATPMISAEGRVVGMTAPRDGEAGQDTILPAAAVAQVARELLRQVRSGARELGFVAIDLAPEYARRRHLNRQLGGLIVAVSPDSPAAQAGLRAGDAIVAVSGKPVSGVSELGRQLDPQAPATLRLIRRLKSADGTFAAGTLTVDLPAVNRD